MSKIQLPITYRVPLIFWFYFTFLMCGLLFIIYRLRSPFYSPIFFLIWLGFLFGICYLGNAQILEIREKCFKYNYVFNYTLYFYKCSFKTGSFQTDWDQVQGVELCGYPLGSLHLVFSIKNMAEKRSIRLGMLNLSKKDLREFLTTLKTKSPQAIFDPDVIKLMG
jgi:hypothetical protein